VYRSGLQQVLQADVEGLRPARRECACRRPRNWAMPLLTAEHGVEDQEDVLAL